MEQNRAARIEVLKRHEREVLFPSFDHMDAWRLGSLVAQRAINAGHRVAIDIRRPGLVLFRASLPGATPDQEEWIRRKSATVLRFESSSALVTEDLADRGIDPFAEGWLDVGSYALAGGSVPVRVAGIGVVAAVTVSGMSSADDHRLVIECMTAYLEATSD